MIQSYRDRFSVQNKLSLALAAGVLSLGQLSAQSILIDVRPVSGGVGEGVEAEVDDFRANDPNIADPLATDVFVEEVANWGALGNLIAIDELGNDYPIDTAGVPDFQFSTNENWLDGKAIYEGYFYENGGASQRNTVTINGMSQYTDGDLITLTVYAVGDVAGQSALVTPTYGTELSSKTTSFGTLDDTDPTAIPSDAEPFVQWQFTADSAIDVLSFTWGSPITTSNVTAALNGFSISGAPPNFGTVTSVDLTPETEVVLVGTPPINLTAIADFQNAQDLDVTSSSASSYTSSDPLVATVDSNGVVTPVGPGATTITVTVSGDAGTTAMDTTIFNVEAIGTLTATPVSRYLLQNGVGTVINVTASSASLTDVRLNELSGLSIMTTDTGILDLSTVGFAQPNNMTGDVTLDVGFQGSTTTAQITVEAATSLTGSFIPDPNLVVNGFSASIDVFAQSTNITDLRINDFPNLTLTYAVSSGTPAGFATVDANGVVTPGGIEGNGAITVTLTNGPSVDVPFTVGQLAPKPTNLWHRYSFNGTNTVTQEEQDDPDNPGSTITVDVTNPTSAVVVDSVRGANGELVGTGGLYNGAGNALALPGGPANGTGTYVNLPNGMISALPAATTFEVWSTNTAPTDWARIFDFGVSVQGEDVSGRGDDYFVLIPQAGVTGNPIAATYSLNADGDQDPFLDSMLTVGTAERHYVVTYDSDEGIMNLYVDGSLGATGPISADRALSRLNDLNNWLGRAQWGDPRYTGILNEFRIYEGTMRASEVSESLADGPDAAIDFTLPPSTDPIPVTDVSFNGSTFSLTFEAEIGSSYQVKVSDDLVSGFTNAPGTSLIVADEATETYTDTTATVDKRFYIVEPVPAP